MSLRGIDAQIMVNRSNDLSPAGAREIRGHDIHQSQIAQKDIKQAERDQTRTIALNKSEFNSVSLQNQGGGAGGRGAQNGKKRKKDKEEEESQSVSDGTHRIDIKV